MGPKQGFPRGRRLRKRRAYLEVQSQGRRFPGRHFLLLVRARPDAQASASSPMAARARFGITVTRKVGNAVTRNRIKRVVRESCRRVGDLFPGGVDVVVVARASAVDAGVVETVAELSLLARRLGARSPGSDGNKSGSAGAGGSGGAGG